MGSRSPVPNKPCGFYSRKSLTTTDRRSIDQELCGQGGGPGLSFQRTLSSVVALPSTTVETAIARCTSRCAMARGHRLNTSIVLAAVHSLSGIFRAVSAVFILSPTPPPPPSPHSAPSPSLISNLASVEVKQYGQQKLLAVNKLTSSPSESTSVQACSI